MKNHWIKEEEYIPQEGEEPTVELINNKVVIEKGYFKVKYNFSIDDLIAYLVEYYLGEEVKNKVIAGDYSVVIKYCYIHSMPITETNIYYK